jgi:two-component system, OmpR family, phosphate regulon response regulator OmpR
VSMSAEPPADDAQHVLVVDDDRRIRDLLSQFLRGHGYRVTTAESAASARARMEGMAFDLIVLDVMMPVETGFQFAGWLRERSAVPILMLTALSDVNDRLRGLELGVDDYLSKPFAPRELLLRIGSILRRVAAPPPAGAEAGERVTFGPFELHVARGELKRGPDIVHVTDRERDLLRTLAEARGGAVAREALVTPGPEGNERSVDVQINRLRRKIETDPTNPLYLQTARGAGYRLAID